MDLRLFLLIVHLIGFALGLGGATISDITFFKVLRSGKFTSSDFSLLLTLSKVIWTGLGLLILSGLSIFALIYSEQGSLPMLASPRWQAKLSLVIIVLFNGLVFKYFIIPFLRGNVDQPISMQTFGSKTWRLAFTGAISIVSWYSILIISTVSREFRPSYIYFMGIWLAVVIMGAVVAQFMLRKSI